MLLYIVRHGITTWNIERRFQGQKDIELDKKGILQAEKTAKYLKDKKIDIIISSPLKRTLETAKIINKYHNVPIEIWEEFIERDFGKIEGKKYSEIDFIKLKKENQFENFEIESLETFKKRIKKGLDKLYEKFKGKTVLLVTHAGVSTMILSIITNKPFEKTIGKNKKPPASISKIEFFEDKNHKIHYFGYNNHLINLNKNY
jgi:broad specificity phosphatase PhoE